MSKESRQPSESPLETPEEEMNQPNIDADHALDDTNAAPADPATDELHTLRTELESLRQQSLRSQADFDNFRKRTRAEKEELQLFATRKLLADLLPVVDNFERALTSIGDDTNVSEVKTGLEMVHRQLTGLLEQQGVTAMDVLGQPFDPNLHNAVMQAPADNQPPNMVIQELQKGYLLHGKVLRPAMVQVSV